jgi:hypothetical protein
MSEQLMLSVKLTDDDAEALEGYSNERLAEAMTERLEEFASAQAKREELRERRPEGDIGDTEEFSGGALEQAMREFLRGDRKDDPRLN